MVKNILIGAGRYKFDIGLITVEPVLFLYMFTTFLFFPILQSLIFDKVCLTKFDKDFCQELKSNSTFKDDHDPEYHDVNSETSHWILKATISLTVPSFIIVLLFLGALGDKVNRKIPVILPCVGAICLYVSGLLNSYYMSASLYYILVGPILNGLCGGYIACLMSTYSYVGHIASPESKMTRIGVLESMAFLSGTIGVFVSGIMLEKQGYIFVFAISCGAMVIALIYAVLWLDRISPLTSVNGQQGGCCRWITSFLRESMSCVAKRRPHRTFLSILLQVISLDVLMFCTAGDFDISLLYLRESLDMSQALYGYYKGLDSFLRGLILVTVLPLAKRVWNVRNLPLVLLGLLSFAANYFVLGIATKKWMPFLAAAVGMFKGLPSSGLRATMSAMVSEDEQGRLFGLIAASESLISLCASLMFNELYPATYKIYHGLCYMLAGGLMIVVFFVILYLFCTNGNNVESEESERYRPLLNDGADQEDDVISPGGVQDKVII